MCSVALWDFTKELKLFKTFYIVPALDILSSTYILIVKSVPVSGEILSICSQLICI